MWQSNGLWINQILTAVYSQCQILVNSWVGEKSKWTLQDWDFLSTFPPARFGLQWKSPQSCVWYFGKKSTHQSCNLKWNLNEKFRNKNKSIWKSKRDPKHDIFNIWKKKIQKYKFKRRGMWNVEKRLTLCWNIPRVGYNL